LVSIHEQETQTAIESFNTGGLTDFWIGGAEGSGPCNNRLCWYPWHNGRFITNGYQNWRGGVPSDIKATVSASAVDFQWDTHPGGTDELNAFVCQLPSYDCGMGLSEACPATSCATILYNDSQAPSGVYWLEPGIDGQDPFENWCDMDRVEGGWTLATTWENVNNSIVNNNSYDPVQAGKHIAQNPETMSTDEHGHVDRGHVFDDLMLSYCDPSDWYVRFSLVDTSSWNDEYLDYLAGQKPTTGWDIYYYMVKNHNRAVDIWARDPGDPEVYLGTSENPFCHAFANTSNTYSTDHRLAWNCELGEGYGGFRSYYMLDGPYGHSVVDVPYDDSDFIDEPGGKMCLWVR